MVVGRRFRTAGRFLAASAAVSLGLFALTPVLRTAEVDVVLGSYGPEVAAGFVLGASAAHACANRGVVTCLVAAYLLVVGVFLSGFVPVGTTGRGNYVVGLLGVSALVAAVVGGVGFLLGTAGAYVESRTRSRERPA